MNRRYIYAGVLSSIFFCICYLALDINVFISIGISLISFVGFVLVYREKDIRKYDSALMMNYSYQTSRLYNIGNTLEESVLKKRVTKIAEISEKILLLLENRPDKVEQGYNFFDYYLPITIRILKQYEIGKNDVLIDKKKELEKLEEHIRKVEMAFEKQLRNMHQDNMLDIESDIRVFEKMLKMDGFIDDMKDVNSDDNGKG